MDIWKTDKRGLTVLLWKRQYSRVGQLHVGSLGTRSFALWMLGKYPDYQLSEWGIIFHMNLSHMHASGKDIFDLSQGTYIV